MPRIRMVDVGLPYKKIMQGSKWVGRVYKNAQGTYTGQIGKNASRIEATGATELEAFNEVGARFFGQPNAAALAHHNAEVQAANRVRRGRVRVLSSNPDFLRRALNNLLGRPGINDLRGEIETQRAMFEAESGMSEDDFVPPPRRRH